jgi:hypothetical protein
MAIDWEAEVGAPNVGVFGGPAIYMPADASTPFGVTGVFDAQYREVVIIDSLSYTSDAAPMIGITDGQFLANNWKPGQNDKLQITDPLSASFGKIFIVKEVRPDSHGITRLVLQGYGGA